MTNTEHRPGAYAAPDQADSAAGWQALRDAVASEGTTLDAWAALANREHGAVNPSRAWHAWLREGGDAVAVVSRALSAYDSTLATIKRGRNKRGATAEVTSRGTVPRLTGADPFRDQASATRDDLVTLDAVTLAALAAAFVALADPDGEPLPVLVGAVQGQSWQSLVSLDDPSHAVALARHRTGLSGGAFPALDAFAAAHGARGAIPTMAATLKRRPSRLRLRLPSLRSTDPDAINAVWHVDSAGSASLVALERPLRRWAPEGRRAGSMDAHGVLVTYGDTGALLAPSSRKVRRAVHYWSGGTGETVALVRRARRAQCTRVHIGRQTVERLAGKVRTSARGARRASEQARAAAARAHVEQCAVRLDAFLDAWHDGADGDAAAWTAPDGTLVTWTRRDGRPMAYRWTRGDQGGRFTARTPGAAAVRLASVVGA